MQTHELEVVIPEDHRLMVEVPETIRSGPAKLVLFVPTETARASDHTAEEARSEEIDHLYTELRELMTRSAAGDDLDEQIRDRFGRLRKLQEAEADAMEARFRARHRLHPGEGSRALERAREGVKAQCRARAVRLYVNFLMMPPERIRPLLRHHFSHPEERKKADAPEADG